MIRFFGEKRRFKRLNVAIPVQLRIVEKGSRQELTRNVEGRLCDLTPAGARLELNTVVVDGLHLFYDIVNNKDRALELILEMPENQGTINGLGRINWYNLIEGGTPFGFAFGIELTDLSPEDRKRLNDYLYHMK